MKMEMLRLSPMLLLLLTMMYGLADAQTCGARGGSCIYRRRFCSGSRIITSDCRRLRRCCIPRRQDPCSPNPCLNGGTCFRISITNSYRCNCPSGFTGSRCQTRRQDPCTPNPCLNGGTCIRIPVVNSHRCNCASGYTGNRCQTRSLTGEAQVLLRFIGDARLVQEILRWRNRLRQREASGREQTLSAREQEVVEDVMTQLKAVTQSSRTKRQAIWPSTRKEYRTLTKSERDKFHAAVHAMMVTPAWPGAPISQYHLLVRLHHTFFLPGAHFGPAYLPWHRILLLIFEFYLKGHEPLVSLPYWDSTLDRGLDNPRHSIIFAMLCRFQGTASGTVNMGPFAFWPIIPPPECGAAATLQRGSSTVAGLLYSNGIISFINSCNNYQDLLLNCFFELFHMLPHLFVGGHMANLPCSPSDPLFWMHHAFVDLLWQDWRDNHQDPNSIPYPSPPPWNPAHAPRAPMNPFGITNRNGINDMWHTSFTIYHPRPGTCTTDVQCGPYLWCDGGHCRSKVRVSGNCNGFPAGSASPCECGKCDGNVCQPPANWSPEWLACFNACF